MEIANYNEPGQTVISGQRPAVEEAARRALAAGAERTVALKVSAPFHCSLMRAMEDEFAAELERVRFGAPGYRDQLGDRHPGARRRPRPRSAAPSAGRAGAVGGRAGRRGRARRGRLPGGPGRVLSGFANRTGVHSVVRSTHDARRISALLRELGRPAPWRRPPDPARGPPGPPRRPLPSASLPLPPPLPFPSLSFLFFFLSRPSGAGRAGAGGRPSERRPTGVRNPDPHLDRLLLRGPGRHRRRPGHRRGRGRAEATLLGQLGAESIDLLDILFRIERATKVKITVADIAALLPGGIPDEEFGDENEVVNDTGLTHLEKVLPQFDRSQLSEPLTAEGVLGLFTVQNLTDLLTERAAARRTGLNPDPSRGPVAVRANGVPHPRRPWRPRGLRPATAPS